MKFGYFFDEAGNCHIQNEEAAVVRFVFTHYANEHKSIDVLSYDLPMEVSPGVLGGKEWRRHVHTILSGPTYAGIQSIPAGFVPGRYPRSFHSNCLSQLKRSERNGQTRVIEKETEIL